LTNVSSSGTSTSSPTLTSVITASRLDASHSNSPPPPAQQSYSVHSIDSSVPSSSTTLSSLMSVIFLYKSLSRNSFSSTYSSSFPYILSPLFNNIRQHLRCYHAVKPLHHVALLVLN